MVIAGATAAAIPMVNVFVAVWGDVAESLTWTIKGYCPDAVGVPVTAPVEALSASPGGNEPETTLQLYGSVPPVAASGAL